MEIGYSTTIFSETPKYFPQETNQYVHQLDLKENWRERSQWDVCVSDHDLIWNQSNDQELAGHGNNIPIGSMYGIYVYIWLIFMVNADKYTIHGSYGIFGPKCWSIPIASIRARGHFENA